MTATSEFKLFPFQEECVEKLWQKEAILIADDMGLGKTVEAIAIDLKRRRNSKYVKRQVGAKTLVIAPLSVLDVWRSHFNRIAPHLIVAVIDPKDRNVLLHQNADVYVVHWNVLALMPELGQRDWFHVIADEAHRAKNRKAQQTQALKKIKTEYKTACTGTPAEDKPHDLWSILNWLYPKEYRSYWRFYNNYVDWDQHPTGKYRVVTGVRNVTTLHREIDKFYIRRQKHAVLKDLPDKYYTTIKTKLTPAQRKAYEGMRKNMLAWVGEHEDQPLAAPVVISRLMRLQQFAICSIDIIDSVKKVKVTKYNIGMYQNTHQDLNVGDIIEVPIKVVKMVEPSSKLDAVMQIIEDNPNESVVVFSQFKQVANLLAERLKAAKVSYGLYTGDTSKEDRDRIVSDFQQGSRKVFIGTIRAGGEGITLTRASTIVFVDRDWAQAKNRQAEDRLHRVGQKNAVQVIDIVAENTVDLGRLQRIEQKWTWIKQLLGDK